MAILLVIDYVAPVDCFIISDTSHTLKWSTLQFIALLIHYFVIFFYFILSNKFHDNTNALKAPRILGVTSASIGCIIILFSISLSIYTTLREFNVTTDIFSYYPVLSSIYYFTQIGLFVSLFWYSIYIEDNVTKIIYKIGAILPIFLTLLNMSPRIFETHNIVNIYHLISLSLTVIQYAIFATFYYLQSKFVTT